MAAVKFGPHLKELRILLCQTSKSSQGAREFIEQQYVSLKNTNPYFPILIRECSSIEPRLYARFEFGKETCVPLANLKSDDILGKVKELSNSQ
ncbi:NADH dehydrogenase [ubiquinone] 1 alpha subcomplex subunit 2 [Leptopilina heterotoma]|uniref:NADH dehydrogenase [ubiquinone] 1 alpha subcomplex subunit 2 n=1 Tax=Leptopilina heterotoma TaxID=63436 RepID=UPI001CA8EA71|nr:NADH dehydrogenase [ubiquinone] 1 alpha subcomplex subunit 2 [Leptopilina heterotoma]